MIIYEIIPTEKTKGYTPAIFAETLGGIFVESPGNGFFKHPIFENPAQLKVHLQKMKKDGFKVKKHTITAKA